MRAVALALALSLATPVAAADGPIRRFALVAGASRGGAERTPLRYATSDARDVSRVLRRLGGVALDDLVLLEEPDAERLRAAVTTVAAEAGRARAAGRRVELFLYYSGHSDESGLLLGASRLTYAELRRELDRVPAEVRVAILDSCASGAITRAKGGTRRPPFMLDASSRVSGHAFLTSSAADEAAQESDRLRASFFTHALVTGLRGAADASGDGVVTLNEAYQFAFRETLAGTEASLAGPQHATYDIGLVGSGDVVMTDLRRADALLVVPEPIEGRVFVRDAAGQLVAELRKARGTRVELAVDEGRHAVQVAQDRRVLAGAFDVAASGHAVIDEARLTVIPREPTLARGDAAEPGPVPAAHDARRRNHLVFTARGGEALRPGPALRGYAIDVALEGWFAGVVGVELASGFQSFGGEVVGRFPRMGTLEDLEAVARDSVAVVPLTATLKLAIPGRWLRPHVLAGVGVSYVHAQRHPVELPLDLVPGYEWIETRMLSAGAHVGAGAVLRFGRRTSAVVDVRYSVAFPAQVAFDEVPLDVLRMTAGLSFTIL